MIVPLAAIARRAVGKERAWRTGAITVVLVISDGSVRSAITPLAATTRQTAGTARAWRMERGMDVPARAAGLVANVNSRQSPSLAHPVHWLLLTESTLRQATCAIAMPLDFTTCTDCGKIMEDATTSPCL